MFKKMFLFFLNSYLWVGVCQMMYVLFSEKITEQTVPLKYKIFLFSCVIASYSYLRISSVFYFLKENASKNWHLFIQCVLFLIVAGGLFWSLPQVSKNYFLLALLFGIFYKKPFQNKVTGIKKIPYVKVFCISFIWVIWSFLLPLEISFSRIMHFLPILSFLFFYILGTTIPFDVRDIERDKTSSVKTFGTFLGRKGATLLSIIFIGISGGIFFFFLEKNLLKTFVLISLATIILLFGIKKQKEYYYSFIVEGMSFIPFVVVSYL